LSPKVRTEAFESPAIASNKDDIVAVGGQETR